MYHELGQLRRALVRVATVPQQELGEKAELVDGKVGSQRGLFALLADDPDSDVCSLNHGDVIASVADAADPFLGELSDEAGDVSFLSRRTTACHDDRELGGDLDKLAPVVSERQLKRLAVDHQRAVWLGLQKLEL